MKKYTLLTGGAGFIGSKLSRKLIELGRNVIILDNLSTGKIENIPEGSAFIMGDTFNKEIVGKIFESYSIESVFHIAGQSSGEVSFENPIYDLESNTLSTLLLLEACKTHDCKSFIFASTMSIYGDSVNELVDENEASNPKSFYAIGKYASEQYMKIYSNFDIKCTALRLFNVYGPGQNMDNMKQGMLSIYLSQAMHNKKIIVKGSGERFRDFVYIDDVVQAFVIAEELKRKFNIYNISSNKKTYVKDLVHKISTLTGSIPVEYIDGTPGDTFGIVGNSESFMKDTSWRAVTGLDDGLKTMFLWAKNRI